MEIFKWCKCKQNSSCFHIMNTYGGTLPGILSFGIKRRLETSLTLLQEKRVLEAHWMGKWANGRADLKPVTMRKICPLVVNRTTRTSLTVLNEICRLPKKSNILNLFLTRYSTQRAWPVLDIPCRSSCSSAESRVHSDRCPHSTAQPQRFNRYIEEVCLYDRDISWSIHVIYILVMIPYSQAS